MYFPILTDPRSDNWSFGSNEINPTRELQQACGEWKEREKVLAIGGEMMKQQISTEVCWAVCRKRHAR